MIGMAGLVVLHGLQDRPAAQVGFGQGFEVFPEVGLDLAFWFTFAGYHQPVSADPRHDIDLSSYGLVSMLPDGAGSGYQGLGWRKRLVFEAMAGLKTR